MGLPRAPSPRQQRHARKLSDWGAPSPGPGAGSRALDYFETNKVAVGGEQVASLATLLGKTALIAMAYDQRFAIAYVSSSGAAERNSTAATSVRRSKT